jgi:hypothetical protein
MKPQNILFGLVSLYAITSVSIGMWQNQVLKQTIENQNITIKNTENKCHAQIDNDLYHFCEEFYK